MFYCIDKLCKSDLSHRISALVAGKLYMCDSQHRFVCKEINYNACHHDSQETRDHKEKLFPVFLIPDAAKRCL